MKNKKSILLTIMMVLSTLIVSIFLPMGMVYGINTQETTTLTQMQPLFKDITGHWAEESITDAVTAGFIKGYEDGTFKPNKPVTRAEFVTMVNGALQLRDTYTVKLIFKDVNKTDWYYKDIQKASYAKYVNGINSSTFAPEAKITRQEAASMLSRLLPKAGYEEESSLEKYPDASNISSWAKNSLAVVINKGYMSGYSNGELNPKGTLTRAEAAKIIGKIIASETIVRDDIYVTKAGDILKDKIYIGNILIQKSVGEGDVTLQNLVALSNVYVYGGGVNTVTMNDTLIISLVINKDGTKVRVLSSEGTTIYSAIVFNDNLLVISNGDIAKPGENGFENIIYVQGTVSQENALKIAAEIAKNVDNTGIINQELVEKTALNVVKDSFVSVRRDGSLVINIPESKPVASGDGGGGSSLVSVKDVTVTGNAVYGDTLTATITPSGAKVNYQWQISDTVDGTFTNISGATSSTYKIDKGLVGKYIKVSATGTRSYTGTVTSTATASITAKELTVTGASAANKVYDGTTTAEISGAALKGKIGTDDVTLENNTSGIFSDKIVGTGKEVTPSMTISGKDVGNYTLTQPTLSADITARELIATAVAQSKTYDGTTTGTGTINLANKVDDEDVTATGTFTFVNKNAATGITVNVTDITLDGANAGNYTVNAKATTTAEITQKPITITADAKSKVYGESDPALTYTNSPVLVGTDTFTGALSRSGDKNAGTYVIEQNTLTISDGNKGANYKITYVGANFSITAKPITITADSKSKVYGESDPTLTYSITEGTLVEGDSITGKLSRGVGNNVGTYAIEKGELRIYDGNKGANYDITYIGKNLLITAKSITITADAKSKVYGETDPTLTYTYADGALVEGDSITGKLSRGVGNNVGTYAIEIGELTINDGNDGKNYNITYVGANFVINKAKQPLILTADSKSKIYGESDPELTYNVTGTLYYGDNSDVVTGVQLSTAIGANATVGTHDINILSGAALNYNLEYVKGTLAVSKKDLTVIGLTGSEKVYDGSKSATVSGIQTLEGIVYNDNVTLTGSPSYTFASPDAANDISITTTGFSLFGDRAGNYTLIQPTLSANIIPAKPNMVTMPTSLKAITYGNKLNDAGITGGYFTFMSSPVAGTFSYTDSSFIPPAGDYGASVTFVPTSSNFASVTPDRKINVTVGAKSIKLIAYDKTKVYGESDPVLTYRIPDGELVKDDDLFIGQLSRTTGENVGFYTISRGTLTNPNYNITVFPGKFKITPAEAELKITPTTSPIIYGDSLNSSSFTGGRVEFKLSQVEGTFTFLNPMDKVSYLGTYHDAEVIFTPSSENFKPLSSFKVDVVVNPIKYKSKLDNNYRIDVNNGTDEERALNILKLEFPSITIIGEQGQTADATITWTLNSNYNGTTAGIYESTGLVNMPYGWTSSGSTITVSATVQVRASNIGESSGTYGEHHYKFIPSAGITWHAAKSAAEGLIDPVTGERGYLATITSAEENNFVTVTLSGEGWLGGSDNDSEGTWLWVTGPEAGNLIDSYYTNYSGGEPNNWGGDEDYLHMFVGGKWNDYKENNSRISGYVVEFGGMAISDFKNTGITDSTATFSWTAPDGATDVKIQKSVTGTGIWTDASTSEGLTLTSTLATVTGLRSSSQYDFRLVVSGGANAGKSNVVSKVQTNVATLEGIKIKTPPENVSYTTGQALDLTGLVLTLSYSDSTTKDVGFTEFTTNGITTDIANGTVLEISDESVEISVNGFTVSQPIYVTDGMDEWIYTIENGKATVTGYSGTDSFVTVPSILGGVPVTGIASNAFSGNSTITKLTIGDNVEIGANGQTHGINNMYALETLILGDKVNIVADGICSNPNLTTIIIGANADIALNADFGKIFNYKVEGSYYLSSGIWDLNQTDI